MFTGIIECLGKIININMSGSNKTFWIESSISGELNADESVGHNGVCLTIEATQDGNHKVTAIKETLDKSNIGHWMIGDSINLERSLRMNGRIDGHIVQGHVDTTAICIDKKVLDGSSEFTFKLKKKFAPLIIEKGSVCVNGISLTAFNVSKNKFTVAIIPYTLEHTNLIFIKEGSKVNIEFDMLGKYVQRALMIKK
ncbi:MAG TPA: riboflavin synthase [Chitinophagaceae bacterium]|nr:riboflavin synthase [Chitinophagaceae bacterium]